MTRLGSLIFCATIGMGAVLLSCGGGSSGGSGGSGGSAGGGAGGTAGAGGTDVVSAIVPGDNKVRDWVRDPSEPKVANMVAAIATTKTAAVDLIDGGADPFYASTTPNVFAWQNYINTNFKPADGSSGYLLKLYVLQMPSAAQATSLYTSLLDGTHSLYSSNANPWVTMSPAIGDEARIVNSLTDWWINFRKGVYYCEVRLTYSESSDAVGKQQTIDFATAVAANM